MFIERSAAAILQEKSKYYPILAITGPRQSGKSTLAKKLFPEKPYCSLEDLDQRQFATEDPRRFLAQFPEGAILDEVQHCPDLFSYLQGIVDSDPHKSLYILTGSQQFGLLAKLTQSLAGRVGFVQLLPFTLEELQAGTRLPSTVDDLLFTGFYPPIYDRNIPSRIWYGDYVMTYIERDLRQLLNIQDLRLFHRFLQLCAARTGQLLNLSNLAHDCGITHNTAKAWISVLEASYILFLLPPHHRNFNKRLTKSPKLYFYDTGLACFLLGFQNSAQLNLNPLRGALFETAIISEFLKRRFNKGLLSNLYFWRDSQGHEIDLLIDQGDQLIPIEIKSGETITDDYFLALKNWQKLSAQTEPGWIIYAGKQEQDRGFAKVLGWRDLTKLPSP